MVEVSGWGGGGVHPYQNREEGWLNKVLATLRGGVHTKRFGIVFTWELEVLAIKERCKKSCLEGGGNTVWDPLFPHFLAPTPSA